MNKFTFNSDEALKQEYKLKDYINDAIDVISDDFINLSHEDDKSKLETLEYIRKYRNILLCINEICKHRKKY